MMPHAPVIAVLLAAVALLCPAQIKVGDRAPEVEADRLFNASFGHTDSLGGKLVLYFWFLPEATDSGALKRAMDAKAVRFRRDGLEVVGITHRDEDAVERWVKLRRPRFTVAWEPSNISMGSYPFNAWPAAALVSPRGIVVYKGDPKGIADALLRKHLKGARGVGPDARLWMALNLPSSLAKASRHLEDGKLDKALDLLAKAKDSDEAAAGAWDACVGLLDSKLAGARSAIAEKSYYPAQLALDRIVSHAPGTPQAESARQLLDALSRDTATLRELRGGKDLWTAELRIEAGRVEQALPLLKRLATGEWEGTVVGERARELLARHGK